MYDPQTVIDQVRRWVEAVVVGLNLCPFASDPLARGKVRIVCSRAQDPGELLAELLHEIDLLEEGDQAETTLLAAPELLRDFDDFLDVLGVAEALLVERGMEGRYQLAHFHPDYRFEGLPEGDPAHLAHCAPHPVLHILRWADVRQAMQTHPNVAQIPIDNQERLRALGTQAVQALYDMTRAQAETTGDRPGLAEQEDPS